MDGARDEAARDDLMPYGVDTIRLRISFPAVPVSQGYDDRMWRMRPLRGWTGGAEWDAREAAAAAQASAGSSLRATLDRVIAAMPAEAPAVEAQGGVQYAQKGPPERDEATRGAEPDEGPLSDAEVFRLEVYGRLRKRLKEIDPENPALQKSYLTGRGGFVPTEADLEALGRAYDDAHGRRSPPQGPVNTFADPGGPESSDAQGSKPTEWGAKPTNSPPRVLTIEDFGIKGNVKELSGIFSIENKIAVVQIDMIEGIVSNPNSILPNLIRLARSNGANILIVRATVANPKLYELMMRMGATSERGVEILTIPLK